jgi:hypothetical protein
MPLRYVPLLLFFLLSASAAAQPHRISGRVADTAAHAPLWRASVALISAEDSILSAFTRTDTAGNFFLKTDSAGRYFVLVSYPGYADFLDLINVNSDVQLQGIALASRAHLLRNLSLRKEPQPSSSRAIPPSSPPIPLPSAAAAA